VFRCMYVCRCVTLAKIHRDPRRKNANCFDDFKTVNVPCINLGRYDRENSECPFQLDSHGWLVLMVIGFKWLN